MAAASMSTIANRAVFTRPHITVNRLWTWRVADMQLFSLYADRLDASMPSELAIEDSTAVLYSEDGRASATT